MQSNKKREIVKESSKMPKKQIVKPKLTKSEKQVRDTITTAMRVIRNTHKIMENKEHMFNLDFDSYKSIKQKLPSLYDRLKKDPKYGKMMEAIEKKYGDKL